MQGEKNRSIQQSPKVSWRYTGDRCARSSVAAGHGRFRAAGRRLSARISSQSGASPASSAAIRPSGAQPREKPASRHCRGRAPTSVMPRDANDLFRLAPRPDQRFERREIAVDIAVIGAGKDPMRRVAQHRGAEIGDRQQAGRRHLRQLRRNRSAGLARSAQHLRRCASASAGDRRQCSQATPSMIQVRLNEASQTPTRRIEAASPGRASARRRHSATQMARGTIGQRDREAGTAHLPDADGDGGEQEQGDEDVGATRTIAANAKRHHHEPKQGRHVVCCQAFRLARRGPSTAAAPRPPRSSQ